MKNLVITFIIGIVIGILIMLYINSKNIVVETLITSSNTNSQIINDNLAINVIKDKVNIETIFTDRYFETTYTNIIVINQLDIERKHAIYFGLGYFHNTQLIYTSFNYSYKSIMFGVNLGYVNRIKELDYGININYIKRF